MRRVAYGVSRPFVQLSNGERLSKLAQELKDVRVL
jgi:hypothetical protein